MKTIFTSIILLVTFNLVGISNAKAQFVTIPDPNFRTWLIQQYPSCFNASQQMDTTCSGIVNATNINLSYKSIQNLSGIRYFDNLDTLYCNNNNIGSLQNLPSNLIYLDCSYNGMLSLQTLTNTVTYLNCSNNQLSNFVSLPSGLIYLNCGDNFLINSLPSLPNSLEFLNIKTCSFSSLPIVPNTLKELNVTFNPINSINSLPDSLLVLECTYCNLNGLPTLPSRLFQLYCNYNSITQLPTLPNTLKRLWCDSNQLTQIPSLPQSMDFLSFQGNQVTNLPQLPNPLYDFRCSGNNISCFPTFPSTITTLYMNNNPATCLPNYLSVMNATWLAIPLCTAGNDNGCDNALGIVGKVYEDVNNNCGLDLGDSLIHNVPVKLFNPSTNAFGLTYTAENGVYNYTTSASTNIVYVDTLNKPYKANCSHPGIDSTVVTTIANPLAQNVNFDIVCKDGTDLSVNSIAHYGLPFPGMNHNLIINAGDASQWYGLHCSAGISGQVQITLNGPATFLGIPSGALNPSINGNVFTYNITDFGLINNSSAFQLSILVDTTAQSGNIIYVNVSVTTSSLESNYQNNSCTFGYFVVNSYDPNYKEVYPINVEPGFNDWLTYTIHFQNLGTAPAFNIRVLDTLNTNLDEQTFEVINYSHYNETTLQNHIVNFRFPNIMLPDSASNPSGSQGFVQYRIKPIPNLPVGAQIENTAHIYFDFNPAIVTNTTVNEYVTTVTASAKNTENELIISPNPSNSVFYVGSNTKAKSLEVFDCVGNTIMQKSNVNNFDLSDFSNGIYFVRVNGNQYSKVIKH